MFGQNFSYYFGMYLHTLRHKESIVTQSADNVFSVDYALLYDNGIRLLIFDYDDTLTGYKADMDERTKGTLQKLSAGAGRTEQSFFVAILSNQKYNKEKRDAIRSSVDVYFEDRIVLKPHPQAYRSVMEVFGVTPEQTAMIGDRIGTDLWGAYCAGIRRRILVAPLSSGNNEQKKPPFPLRILRWIEQRIAG